MKKCTVCEAIKDCDDFYYDTATDTLSSKCRPCQIKFNVLARRYRREGNRLTTKEFKSKGMWREKQ